MQVVYIKHNNITAGYTVHVLSDCITSYDLKKLPEMLAYYEKQGCELINLGAKLINNHQTAASLNEKAMRRTQEP